MGYVKAPPITVKLSLFTELPSSRRRTVRTGSLQRSVRLNGIDQVKFCVPGSTVCAMKGCVTFGAFSDQSPSTIISTPTLIAVVSVHAIVAWSFQCQYVVLFGQTKSDDDAAIIPHSMLKCLNIYMTTPEGVCK